MLYVALLMTLISDFADYQWPVCTKRCPKLVLCNMEKDPLSCLNHMFGQSEIIVSGMTKIVTFVKYLQPAKTIH